jgi:hypothetical protein
MSVKQRNGGRAGLRPPPLSRGIALLSALEAQAYDVCEGRRRLAPFLVYSPYANSERGPSAPHSASRRQRVCRGIRQRRRRGLRISRFPRVRIRRRSGDTQSRSTPGARGAEVRPCGVEVRARSTARCLRPLAKSHVQVGGERTRRETDAPAPIPQVTPPRSLRSRCRGLRLVVRTSA